MIILHILLALFSVYLIYILLLFLLSLTIRKKEYMKESPFFRFLLNQSTRRALYLLGVRIHVTNLDKIPDTKRILFVSNHRSNYDPIISWGVLRKWHPSYVSKEANFHIPIYGRLIRKCCFLSIDRDSIRSSSITFDKASELLKKGEVSVAIYPEGKRSKNGTLLPFHDCVFKVAQKADAKIVVLTIKGTEKIFSNIKRLKKSHVYLDVLAVIGEEEIKNKRSIEIGEEVRALMERSLGE